MRKFIFAFVLVVFSTLFLQAQQVNSDLANEYKRKLGIKAGHNWSYLSGSTNGFNKDSKTGFMFGAFFAPASKGIGYRSEVIFSRQGYSFEEGGKNTDVLNDYIYLPQLTTFTIAKKLQLQLGAQVGFLLNAKKSSAVKDTTITGLMNRIDYGFAGGVEIYPFKGLLVGGRYNLGLGKLYKRYEQAGSNPYPLPFNPENTDFKNGVVQLFVGYRF
ncbi:MAG TPA: outer membrane beta-barrel protein [Chitinophagaceae bacterium]|nr:outer membrane beta-barrel protein [Chitinophagaceae bacterium]